MTANAEVTVNTAEVTANADVIVVGGGPGGCASALTAARHGASVILLEAGERVGGNAARSTGYLAFQDFAMQHEAGIEDSVEKFMADMRAEVELQSDRYGLIFDDELAELFARESSDTYSFLIELGFRFNRFLRRPKQHTTDRMVDVADTAMFTELFETALADAGVDVQTKVRAERLITDGDAVIGVRTESAEFHANNGVILAAGGYQANPALRARYQPASMASTPYLGTEDDRGDGHLMGQAVGGDLINMTMIPPLIMVASALVEESITVNLEGRRFHDEAGPYDDRVEALSEQSDGLAWYIFDDRVAQAKSQLIEQMPFPAVSAPTLETLARKLSCNPDGLIDTVCAWNETVTSGLDKDLEHGRVIFPDPRVGIVEPPFHACRMVVGINFPAGGFRVTTDMQVLDVFGDPIAGLFAVGDCVGGVSPTIGLGGTKISAALSLGRVAGRVTATGDLQALGGSAVAGAPALPGSTMRIAVIDE